MGITIAPFHGINMNLYTVYRTSWYPGKWRNNAAFCNRTGAADVRIRTDDALFIKHTRRAEYHVFPNRDGTPDNHLCFHNNAVS